MVTIARIHNDLDTKFGVPRQSGLVPSLRSTIVFEPPFRNADAVRGLDGFSHIWLLWDFHESHYSPWSPTVRPPRLGGNKRMGVFATRSPFRPNSIGLSSVRLLRIEHSPTLGPVLLVEGADLMNGTPILDIKPYLAYTDCHPSATGGFTDEVPPPPLLQVSIPDGVKALFSAAQLEALHDILSHDPRPQYHDSPTRAYNITYAHHELRFQVQGDKLTLLEP